MQLFNFDYIKQLKDLVKSEEDRHYLIGLSVFIGSYKARKELSSEGYFTGLRDTTSKIAEARYIVSQHQETIRSLKTGKQKEKVRSDLEAFLEEVSENNLASQPLI